MLSSTGTVNIPAALDTFRGRACTLRCRTLVRGAVYDLTLCIIEVLRRGFLVPQRASRLADEVVKGGEDAAHERTWVAVLVVASV